MKQQPNSHFWEKLTMFLLYNSISILFFCSALCFKISVIFLFVPLYAYFCVCVGGVVFSVMADSSTLLRAVREQRHEHYTKRTFKI